MRSALIAAAFAAGVLAVPNKRDLATTVQIDVVTAFVTVTAGTPAATSAALFNANNRVLASAPASAPAAATSTTAVVVGQTQDASSDVQGEVEQTTDDSQQQAPSSDNSQSQGQSQGQDQSSNAAPQTADQGSSSNSGSSSSSDADSTAVDVYSAAVVHHHEMHRSNHSSPALKWDAKLAGIANDIAKTCVYGHNTEMGGGGYGQNIAAGVSPDGIGRIITEMFYNNEVNYYNDLYDISDPSDNNFEAWGHFSQIVWKNTESVGCATYDCSSSGVGWFTVCNYSPPGNWAGQYGANILRPKGDATAYGDS